MSRLGACAISIAPVIRVILAWRASGRMAASRRSSLGLRPCLWLPVRTGIPLAVQPVAMARYMQATGHLMWTMTFPGSRPSRHSPRAEPPVGAASVFAGERKLPRRRCRDQPCDCHCECSTRFELLEVLDAQSAMIDVRQAALLHYVTFNLAKTIAHNHQRAGAYEQQERPPCMLAVGNECDRDTASDARRNENQTIAAHKRYCRSCPNALPDTHGSSWSSCASRRLLLTLTWSSS